MMFDGYSDLNGDAYPVPKKPEEDVFTENQEPAEGVEPLAIDDVFGHKPLGEAPQTTDPEVIQKVGGSALVWQDSDGSLDIIFEI